MQCWHSLRLKRTFSMAIIAAGCLVGVLQLAAFLKTGTLFAGEKPTRAEAVGNLTGATALERAAYADDAAFFQPIRDPAPMDWLAQHQERGQTVAQYHAALATVKPRPHQTTLYLQPVGDFSANAAPPLDKLRDYCAAFFGMRTEVLKALPVDQVPAKSRINQNTKKRQLRTPDILAWLATRKPANAYSLIAVTMEDLYPEESWNFVFGQARLLGGTGVFSFARYDPAFFGEPRDAETASLVLRRSCKVLSHETGHMFGLDHCIFFECVMNGANHLGETDARPMHLCPVCLHKLQLGAGFDLLRREEALQAFLQANDLKDEAAWSTRRLEKLRQVK
ncbi:MAG: archaemetzincin [Prosthecobacter sp.]